MRPSNLFPVAVVLSVGLFGCAKSSGNEDLDRCEAAARKISEVFAGDNDELRAQRYIGALELCTLEPDKTLNAIGDAYLTCVDEAPHGAALLRCRYEMEAAIEAEALAQLEAAALPLMKDVCAGKLVDGLDADERYKQVSELESKAREVGVEGEEIDALLTKIKREAGCPSDADASD